MCDPTMTSNMDVDGMVAAWEELEQMRNTKRWRSVDELCLWGIALFLTRCEVKAHTFKH